MTDWIKRALTRRISRKGPRGKDQIIVVQPNQNLVLLVKFSIGMALCLTCLEVAHLAFLGIWNSEVFAAITALAGAVTGVFIGHHA
jgi:hypothetical protein